MDRVSLGLPSFEEGGLYRLYKIYYVCLVLKLWTLIWIVLGCWYTYHNKLVKFNGGVVVGIYFFNESFYLLESYIIIIIIMFYLNNYKNGRSYYSYVLTWMEGCWPAFSRAFFSSFRSICPSPSRSNSANARSASSFLLIVIVVWGLQEISLNQLIK